MDIEFIMIEYRHMNTRVTVSTMNTNRGSLLLTYFTNTHYSTRAITPLLPTYKH